MTEPDGSITRCIAMLRRGDRAAAQELWGRYFHRLVGLARAQLRDSPRRASDEEDVALSAFESFYAAAERGRFPRLADRDDLWQMLFVITVRKSIDQVQHERRQVRGGGRVSPFADLTDAELGRLADDAPSPALAAQVAEEFRRLLDALGDETLRAVALRKLEGHTNDEIAAELGCVRQTVERKLRRIRTLWAGETPP